MHHPDIKPVLSKKLYLRHEIIAALSRTITHICLKVFTKSYKRSLAHGLRRHYHTVTPQL